MPHPDKLWKIILYFSFVPFRVLLLVLLISLFGINRLPDVSGQFLSSLLSLLVLTLIFGLYKKDKFSSFFKKGFNPKYLLAFILLAVLVRLPLLPFVFGLLNDKSVAAISSQWPTMSAASGVSTHLESLLLFLNLVILTPVLEETFHRGIIFPYLRSRLPPVVAIFVSGLLFAFTHGNILLVASTFISGIVFAFVYYKTTDLKYPILLHSLVNLFPFLFSYLFTLVK